MCWWIKIFINSLAWSGLCPVIARRCHTPRYWPNRAVGLRWMCVCVRGTWRADLSRYCLGHVLKSSSKVTVHGHSTIRTGADAVDWLPVKMNTWIAMPATVRHLAVSWSVANVVGAISGDCFSPVVYCDRAAWTSYARSFRDISRRLLSSTECAWQTSVATKRRVNDDCWDADVARRRDDSLYRWVGQQQQQ